MELPPPPKLGRAASGTGFDASLGESTTSTRGSRRVLKRHHTDSSISTALTASPSPHLLGATTTEMASMPPRTTPADPMKPASLTSTSPATSAVLPRAPPVVPDAPPDSSGMDALPSSRIEAPSSSISSTGVHIDDVAERASYVGRGSSCPSEVCTGTSGASAEPADDPRPSRRPSLTELAPEELLRRSVEAAAIARRSMSSMAGVLQDEVGDVPFLAFTVFLFVLFMFALVAGIFLMKTDIRSREHGIGFSAPVLIFNYLWCILQIAFAVDLTISYYNYFRPKESDKDKPKFFGSKFNQPYSVGVFDKMLGMTLPPRAYLLLLAVILPINSLFFYPHIGSPLYTSGQLEGHNVDELLQNIPAAGAVPFNPGERGWAVNIDGGTVLITNTECYQYQSPEFRILQKLSGEELPKQAYCESLIGTMLAEWRRERSNKEWQHDEDIWEEAFQFSTRVFGSLAGVVADQTSDTNHMTGNWFLRDMTDVFDMYMMAFVDVDQMHEGRPLLEGSHGLFNSRFFERSYHTIVATWIWLGYITICLRALSIVGWRPIVRLAIRLGSEADEDELNVVIDAALALTFIDAPFLFLRYIAWKMYGVPVSLMGVKNVFGIFEYLHALGLMCGFRTRSPDGEVKKRGIWLLLCCRRFQRSGCATE